MANIFQEYLKPVKSVQDYSNAMDIADEGRIKLQQAQQGIEDSNALREAAKAFGTDSAANLQALRSRGLYKAAQDYQKADLESQKTKADISHTGAQTGEINNNVGLKRLNTIDQTLSSLQGVPGLQPQHVTTAIQHLGDIGIIPAPMLAAALQEVPQDAAQLPAFLKQKMDAAMTAKEQKSFITPDANEKLKSDTLIATNKATNNRIAADAAESRRQAERHFTATLGKPFEVTGEDGRPVLVQQDKSGNIMPVQGYQPKAAPLKPLPPSVNEAIIGNAQSLYTLDKAIKLAGGASVDSAKGDAAATGWKGYLPQGMLNHIDPSGIDTRAEIADIGSLKIHDRSGAAVTASESPRLMPFIPSATDNKETVVRKLTRLKEEAQRMQTRSEDTRLNSSHIQKSRMPSSA